MSPAWRIASTPASACSASGRIRPCVSEMTPIRGSSPDGGLLGPDRVLESIFECLCSGFECARIVGRFVARNAGPVHRLGGSLGAGKCLDHIAELPLGVCEILPIEL